jgi:hypothetical protein
MPFRRQRGNVLLHSFALRWMCIMLCQLTVRSYAGCAIHWFGRTTARSIILA